MQSVCCLHPFCWETDLTQYHIVPPFQFVFHILSPAVVKAKYSSAGGSGAWQRPAINIKYHILVFVSIVVMTDDVVFERGVASTQSLDD